MYVRSLLFCLFFEIIFPVPGSSGVFDSFTKVTVTPTHQSASVNENVVMYCSDRENSEVVWERLKNKSFPLRARQSNGQLSILKVRKSDSGFYTCKRKDDKTGTSAALAYLRVTDDDSTPGFTPWSVISTAKPNYIKNPPLTTLAPLPTSKAVEEWYTCANGDLIDKSLVCNRENDCKDGSDEADCVYWAPKITVLPEKKVEVLCGDNNEGESGVLVLECEFVGNPEPLIKWKKYEGHVPSKCQQISIGGFGTLKCENFQQSDQGAYSCVAENSKGSSESQPKSVAKCSNTLDCKGFKVISEENIENCIECFCSGKTNQCRGMPSNLTIKTIPFPVTKEELFAVKDGEIVFIPSEAEPAPSLTVRKQAQEVTYCSLFKEDLNDISFLKSYGRNIKIPRYRKKIDFLPGAPDLIIRGNDLALMYKFNQISHSADATDVRFWPGNWHYLNKTIARRGDLMKVLSNLDALLFRCEYKQGEPSPFGINANIIIESSVIADPNKPVSYVEKCNCPPGYDGLSCESCAPGYKREVRGNDFVCINPPPLKCKEGWTGYNCSKCDESKNYYPYFSTCIKSSCSPEGSVSQKPTLGGKCECKKNVVGDSCDTCKEGFFNLQKGCLECWCSGVTKQCSSSNWIKTTISSTSLGGYNSSEGRNFWLLPSIFNGNRLTSYGGHLNYTMKYVANTPKQKTYLTVEILSLDDVTLYYKHSHIDLSYFNNEKSWSVNLTEESWKKFDNTSVTRPEFLAVLSKVKAVYIEAPYHLSSNLVNLTSARMTSATAYSYDNGELASSVEKCVCPKGYEGLSCEKCARGYYKSRNGSITRCVKCECLHCDPEHGCSGCNPGFYRDNPIEEKKPVCKPCTCHGNEMNCYKDNYAQIICICKPGFLGMHCEKVFSSTTESYLNVTISPSRVKNTKVGSIVKFNCSYVSDEQMKITVKKTYGKGHQVAVDRTNSSTIQKSYGSLKSFDVVLDDDLVFVECFVHNTDEKEVGHVKALIDLVMVSQPVKILKCDFNRIDVIESEERDLICEATGVPTPTVSWYKTKDGHTEKVDTIEGVHSLGSNDTAIDRNGTVYMCVAENSEGDKDTCPQVLHVRKKCEIIRVTPSVLRVREGESILLQCKTTAKSPIVWSKVESSLPPSALSKNNINIINATVGDSGTYMCKAYTGSEFINSTATVVVEEKRVEPSVRIPENDVRLKVGDNFEVVCLGTGKPAPTITWRKLNDYFPTNAAVLNNTLKIKSATLQNSGLYECRGESVMGNASSQIFILVEENKIKPTVRIQAGSSVNFTEGNYGNVICSAEKGTPKPKLEWWKEIKPWNWNKIEEDGSLSIWKVSLSDAGRYKCKGTNSAGEDEAYVQINVMVPPRVNVSQTEIVTYENQMVTITCSAYGIPKPQISWNGAPNTQTEKVNNRVINLIQNPPGSVEDEISFRATLDLDKSVVTCIASNDFGSANSSTKLTILQSAESEEGTLEFAPLGSYFELHCSPPTGNATWEKLGGRLIGDECEIPNGLLIPSVQVQHRGKYVCKWKSEFGTYSNKTFSLNVTGFVPKFKKASRSYMILPVTLKSPEEASIRMSFNPAQENGMLLMNQNNKFFLYLKKGIVHFMMKSKSNDILDINCNNRLRLHHWYSLNIDIKPTYIDITIYDQDSFIFERKTEKFENFDIVGDKENNFFIGGSLPAGNMIRHAHTGLMLHIPSFDGCISRLTINRHEYDLVQESSYSFNVTLCKRCSEEQDPCLGKGKCFDAPTQYGFVCVCPEDDGVFNSCPGSCAGKGCETSLDLCKLINPCKTSVLHSCSANTKSLHCNCAFGYSGNTCEKVEERSFCVQGNGFVRLPAKLLRRHLYVPEVIKMSFTIQKPDGLLLWQGDYKNHLSIGIQDSQLEYVYLSQGVKLLIQTNMDLNLNEKYSLTVTRKNNTATLELLSGSKTHTKHKNSTLFVTDRVYGDIFLGNYPEDISFYNRKYKGLTGCIHFIGFGNKTKINLREYATEKLNVVIPKALDPDYSDSNDSQDGDDETNYDTYGA